MRVALVVPFLLAVTVAPLAAQNSTRKIRNKPTDLAARVGSAVQWRTDVGAALAEAKTKGKPVFWYVPAVARSPMDRKPEIDRYLRGGPFSWPTTIELLNTQFIPVAEVAKGERKKQYQLEPMKFLEPGYLVLDGEGAVVARLDQITTLHPQWFEAPLRRLAKAPLDGFPGSAALREAWAAYRGGDCAAAVSAADAVLAQKPADAVAAEAHWLAGVATFRSKGRAAAVERWTALAQALPEQPLAWKAALECEGLGPFVHAFEDYLPLPEAVLAKAPVDGSRTPGVYSEAELWQRGVAFLCAMDDGDGVLRDSIYDFGGSDGLPNVYAAVTCLAGEALLRALDLQARGAIELPAPLRARAETMLQRILQNVRADAWVALSDRDEIVWPRAYALRFLAAWQAHRAGDREALRPLLQRGVGSLLALEQDTGTWFHEYDNPFATATALQALFAAKASGVEVPQADVDRGLRALVRNRAKEGGFTYGDTKRGEPSVTVQAGSCRMPLCELGLFLFGASDAERLQAAVAAGHRYHGQLAEVRKYDDHAGPLHYGGFFFWFDMLGRTEAALQIADKKVRAEQLAAQQRLVLDLPEFDGCFVDSHELGRCYGTAMALLCLYAIRTAP